VTAIKIATPPTIIPRKAMLGLAGIRTSARPKAPSFGSQSEDCTAVETEAVQYRSRVMTDYGWSAVSISSLANGAVGFLTAGGRAGADLRQSV
jgi:hypothetical protein